MYKIYAVKTIKKKKQTVSMINFSQFFTEQQNTQVKIQYTFYPIISNSSIIIRIKI